MESLGGLSLEECGEGVEEAFRERGYSEGDKDRKRGKGLFRRLSGESDSTMTLGKIPLAPMGVLAPGSAHVRPSAQPPIVTSGNFPARVSAELPSNISPNPSEVISEVLET